MKNNKAKVIPRIKKVEETKVIDIIKDKKKSNVGRPSKYLTHVKCRFDEIRALRRDGQTEENIAKILGIAYSTLSEYKLKYEEFTEVLKESKEKLISELEDTMFQMALGKKKKKTVKNYYERNPMTNKLVLIKSDETIEDIPPHPTMIIFSLKNLSSDKWKDRRDIDITQENSESKIVESIDTLINTIKQKGDEQNET